MIESFGSVDGILEALRFPHCTKDIHEPLVECLQHDGVTVANGLTTCTVVSTLNEEVENKSEPSIGCVKELFKAACE